MSLYLTPHAYAVVDALAVAPATGLPTDVTTIAEAVGSDITNVVRSCVEAGRFGAAAHLFTTYLANDRCVAVSAYTRELIIDSAVEIDARHGTSFASSLRASASGCRTRRSTRGRSPTSTRAAPRPCSIGVASSPTATCCSCRVLTKAKGVNDLINAYARSRARHDVKLVIAGNGPE